MTVYAKYNVDTKEVTGWYFAEYVDTPPQPHIVLTKAQHETFVSALVDSTKIAMVEDGRVVIRTRINQISWDDVRNKRDSLLRSTDYTQIPDYSHENKEAYKKYRQALRDLPQTYEGKNPIEIIWPKINDFI